MQLEKSQSCRRKRSTSSLRAVRVELPGSPQGEPLKRLIGGAAKERKEHKSFREDSLCSLRSFAAIKSLSGLTEVELLVAISVLAIFATLAVPSAYREYGRSSSTKALANAKQIGLACKLFAGDHDGKFPANLLDSEGKLTSTEPTNSNDALAQLIPDYMPDEKIFWMPEDKYYCSPTEPDGRIDPTGTIPRKLTLAAGENHWAYVTHLSETSKPQLPLIADSTLPGTTKYSPTKGTAGGTWLGRKAIVIRVDGSGAIERVNPKTMTVVDNSSGLADILKAGQKDWLGPENKLLNPIPAPQGR